MLTVTDANGCSYTTQTQINQPTALESSISAFKEKIDLTIEGGTPQYTYLWNTGDTTQDLTNVPSGFYEVLIVDGNNCMISENVIIKNQEINVATVEEMSKNEFEIYPNPATDVITINTNKIIDEVTFTNLNGQNINIKVENQKANISMLPAGVYIITINNTQKFITKY